MTTPAGAEDLAAAHELVTAMSPSARRTYAVGGTQKYELPTAEISLSQVSRAGMCTWLISRCSTCPLLPRQLQDADRRRPGDAQRRPQRCPATSLRELRCLAADVRELGPPLASRQGRVPVCMCQHHSPGGCRATAAALNEFSQPVCSSQVFRRMDAAQQRVRILDWGVANATLEEVFIKFAQSIGAEGGS